MLFAVICLAPLDIEADTVGINPDTGEEITRKARCERTFCRIAFKIMTDPFVGRLAFFRCYMRSP